METVQSGALMEVSLGTAIFTFGASLPCSSLDVPSGTYLSMTFLLRYWTKPYTGDFSSYCSIAILTSTTPPVPLCRRLTVFLVTYFNRNLERKTG